MFKGVRASFINFLWARIGFSPVCTQQHHCRLLVSNVVPIAFLPTPPLPTFRSIPQSM